MIRISEKAIMLTPLILGSIEGINDTPESNPLSAYLGEFARVRQVATTFDKKTGKRIPGLTPFSVPTVWRKVSERTFPAPVKLSAGVTAWRVSEIRAWLAEKQASSDSHTGERMNPVPRQPLS